MLLSVNSNNDKFLIKRKLSGNDIYENNSDDISRKRVLVSVNLI